ncbi:flagellar assembly protein FliX [Roseococcus sp. SYP-B2431]|uniref:flagellar assembly protein FliX n=1 Tax=Roseococcus sp. SYP-B2431 TaxID=2496640 RepID=UPI0013F42901|nr:flagellar assembly protein FliX [Roseococcus sp. SYP-B2431]
MLTPIRGYTAIGRGGAARRPGRGFALPEAERGQEPAAAAPVASHPGLIGLQEGLSDTERDGAAQRRGKALLEELEGLQLALLTGRIDPGRLSRLAQLAGGESGADPALRDLLRAISLRARIELERLPTAPA